MKKVSFYDAFKRKFIDKKSGYVGRRYEYRAYINSPGKPVWTERDYTRFASEGYAKNVIAFRCIDMLSECAAAINFRIEGTEKNPRLARLIEKLLNRPNPAYSRSEFFEALYCHRLISGNSYILAVGADGSPPNELHILRPDRVSALAGKSILPSGYRYQVGEKYVDYKVNAINGFCKVLHLKTFHPLSDYYGLSPMEAAAYSIDQHNQAGAWNQSMLQNGARPSGALIVRGDASLSEDQYLRLKNQMDEQFSGDRNAGRPLLLEGGLDWKEMSISPRDMDFINAKNSSARDIALAFGVPPQLLGIPGDNTYSNLKEARLAFWEDTVIPLVDSVISGMEEWLLVQFGASGKFRLTYNLERIPAMQPRRDELWARLKDADFISDEVKRNLVAQDL